MRACPAALTPDRDGGFTGTFRDVPEAITEGDSREEALLRAEDALESALAMYIAAKEPLPTSSETEVGEEIVPLSAVGMAKTGLYDARATELWAGAHTVPFRKWRLREPSDFGVRWPQLTSIQRAYDRAIGKDALARRGSC